MTVSQLKELEGPSRVEERAHGSQREDCQVLREVWNSLLELLSSKQKEYLSSLLSAT